MILVLQFSDTSGCDRRDDIEVVCDKHTDEAVEDRAHDGFEFTGHQYPAEFQNPRACRFCIIGEPR